MSDNVTALDLNLNRYSMKSDLRPKIGRVAIFNNSTFVDRERLDRPGSEKDANDIAAVLREYGFEVDEIYQDLDSLDSGKKLKDIVEKEDLLQYNCFICVFLSHGEGDKIFMHEGLLHIQDNILDRFRKCKGLGGKPKIFIIQACRGRMYDDEVDVCHSEQVTCDVTTESDDAVPEEFEEVGSPKTTPAGADFLVCYATAHGCRSFRNSGRGTRFIQNIVKVLRAYKSDQSQPEMDLASLMTKVAELVSEQRSPGVGQDGQELTKLQIPCIVSTLKKQIFLPRE